MARGKNAAAAMKRRETAEVEAELDASRREAVKLRSELESMRGELASLNRSHDSRVVELTRQVEAGTSASLEVANQMLAEQRDKTNAAVSSRESFRVLWDRGVNVLLEHYQTSHKMTAVEAFNVIEELVMTEKVRSALSDLGEPGEPLHVVPSTGAPRGYAKLDPSTARMLHRAQSHGN
jgi:predicted secreted protein